MERWKDGELIFQCFNIWIFQSFNCFNCFNCLNMVDSIGGYRWWSYVQRLSPGEIKKMKKNMKKVPIISLKSDIYHKKEEQEAERVLEELPHTEVKQEYISENNFMKKNTNWILSKIRSLRQYFISLF